MDKVEHILFDALRRLVRLDALEDSGEQAYAPSAREWQDAWIQAVEALAAVQFDPKALDHYVKQKREWPDKETVIKAAELEFQNISSGQMEDMAVHAFREGVEWVKSYLGSQGKSQSDRKVVSVLEYCKPHINQMWAATIVGILLDCDFREAHAALNTQGKLGDAK
jgi:hypothetical protein